MLDDLHSFIKLVVALDQQHNLGKLCMIKELVFFHS